MKMHAKSRALRLILSFAFILLTCLTAIATEPPASHLAPPAGLRVDGFAEPLALANPAPAFSWSLAAASPALHSVRQSAYQLRVTAAGQAPLWQTSKVSSRAASGVAYQGPALEPEHRYSWQVRVWDETGQPTPWSAPAHWRQSPEFHAQWIAAHATDADAGLKPLPLFRKAFDLPAPVTRATLYASGLGQDELRLNGRKVGSDQLTPGWSDYRKTIYYDAYDVTALLKPGPNALGVLLGNGMYRVLDTPTRYIKFTGSYGPPKCLVQLSVDLANGQHVLIASDGSWKTAPGPVTFSSTYGGEDYDARLDLAGWDTPGYDDAQWSPALLSTSPGGALRPEQAPPIRVMHTYGPVKVTQLKPGVQVYDLGQNFAGWPEITVSGPAGSSVKLIPGELLQPDGAVSQKSSGEPQWYAYTLKGGPAETWHPRFAYYGFRYVQVETAPSPGATAQPRIVKLAGLAVHTSSETIGSFESSDSLLNRIHTLIVRSIENNAVSLFTDCPHREKLGWLEETHLMAPSMLYDFDFSGLYAATARNLADAQKPDGPKAGMIPEIAPHYVIFQPEAHEEGIFDDSPEWGSAAVLAPWYVFERTGDLPRLASQLDMMARYTSYLGTRAKDGIIAYGLGDWYDIGPGEPGVSQLTTLGLTATATYYQDLQVLERTTALLGKTDESRAYHDKIDALRALFNARFFHPEHHIYDKGSQAAQAMPLVLGIVPEAERPAVLQALVDDIRSRGNHVTAGDIGYHYVVDALLDGGRSDVLYDMLERTDTPSYGYQLAQGATALTEAWDANPSSSQDHFMLGHAEEWFYRGLGGIQVNLSAAAPRQIVLQPSLEGKLTSVRTRYLSSLGPIRSEWERGPSATAYTFDLPPNAAATVLLNTAAPSLVTVNGLPAAKAPGVQSVKVIGNSIELVLGSGSYSVSAANPVKRQP